MITQDSDDKRRDGPNMTDNNNDKTITVSGNNARLWRLDPEGNPIGEPIRLTGPTSFDIPADKVEDFLFDRSLDQVTMELTLSEVDSDLLALLTGQHHKAPSRWQRFKRWVKRWLVNEEWRNLRCFRWLP